MCVCYVLLLCVHSIPPYPYVCIHVCMCMCTVHLVCVVVCMYVYVLLCMCVYMYVCVCTVVVCVCARLVLATRGGACDRYSAARVYVNYINYYHTQPIAADGGGFVEDYFFSKRYNIISVTLILELGDLS